MGTNYYAQTNHCPTCGSAREEIHIGKQSAGWKFLFRARPDLGLVSKRDWQQFLAGVRIKDEYGEDVTFSALLHRIETVQSDDGARNHIGQHGEYADPEGYRMLDADFS